MSLRELALKADEETKESLRRDAVARREQSLDKMIENWVERWHLKLEETPECPPREAFAYKKVTYGNGTGRYPSVEGWMFTIDGIDFIYSKDQGMCVILTCPDCGERHADSWYGMADLGKRLKAQRTYLHECHQVAARKLAYALKEATRATNLPASSILDEALEIYQGFRS